LAFTPHKNQIEIQKKNNAQKQAESLCKKRIDKMKMPTKSK